MKLLAFLIIAISLVVGVIGAMTAYLAPTTLADELLVGEQLNANAGVSPEDPTGRTPLARRGDEITPDLLAALRAQNVTRIHLERFEFRRWTGWPLFVIGCAGLFGGAMLLRVSNRRALSAAMGPAAVAGAAPLAGSPEAAILAIRGGIDTLRQRLATLSHSDKLDVIIEIFGEAQAVHIPAFIAGRPQLVARLGLAGYAQLMDSFAAAERQLNRAWSAAADGVLDEALDCVEAAHILLDRAEAKLK
jgi:hypothetical protein